MTHSLTFITLRRAAAATLLALLCCMGASAAERGEKSFGPKAGFNTRNTSALAGLTFEYSFSRHVRIAPAIGIVFRNKDLDALTVDVDMHFPLGKGTKAAFYPLVGLAFNSWGRHGVDADNGNDVTTHSNALGLNGGAGVELRLTKALKLGLEAKYTLIQHYPNASVAARIAYVF